MNARSRNLTNQLSFLSLAGSAGLILGLAALNRAGVLRPAAYILIGKQIGILGLERLAILLGSVPSGLSGYFLLRAIPARRAGA